MQSRPINETLATGKFNIFSVRKQQIQRATPHIIFLVDRSGSMSGTWPYVQASANCLIDKINQHFGTLDKVTMYLFGSDVVAENSKYITLPVNGGTDFGIAFSQLDHTIDQIPPQDPIKIVFVSDGGANWNLSLGGHKGRNITFLTVGIGSGFPFEAAQFFYSVYHNSRVVNSLFHAKNIDGPSIQREFEEIEPYLFDVDNQLTLDIPLYMYPWSNAPENTVYENTCLISDQPTLSLNGGQLLLKPEPKEHLIENSRELHNNWYLKVMRTPTSSTDEKTKHISMAKTVQEGMISLRKYVEHRIKDPIQLAELPTSVYQSFLGKVVDSSYYGMSELEKANMLDTKTIEGTNKLNLDELRKRREEKERQRRDRELAAQQQQIALEEKARKKQEAKHRKEQEARLRKENEETARRAQEEKVRREQEETARREQEEQVRREQEEMLLLKSSKTPTKFRMNGNCRKTTKSESGFSKQLRLAGLRWIENQPILKKLRLWIGETLQIHQFAFLLVLVTVLLLSSLPWIRDFIGNSVKQNMPLFLVVRLVALKTDKQGELLTQLVIITIGLSILEYSLGLLVFWFLPDWVTLTTWGYIWFGVLAYYYPNFMQELVTDMCSFSTSLVVGNFKLRQSYVSSTTYHSFLTAETMIDEDDDDDDNVSDPDSDADRMMAAPTVSAKSN